MKLKEAKEFYSPFLKDIHTTRRKQLDIVCQNLESHFKFDKLEVIETGASQNLGDGCFGLFFCKLAMDSGGVFHSVDVDPQITEKSKEMYSNFFPIGSIFHATSDSVKFLKEYMGFPNLVHLDSWDLNMKNPVPSMLHGWLEFEAIKDKMPSGSICIIDDNYMKGTDVFWNWTDHNTGSSGTDIIEVGYDIIGKASLIYHWAMKEETDWDIIGDHYCSGDSIKVLVQKR